MKITIPTATLTAMAARVGPAAANRTTRPALACLRLTADDSKLTVMATDTEVSIESYSTSLTVHESGSCLIPYERLSAILKTCDEADVAISGDDTSVMVQNGTARFDLPGYPVDEFPAFDRPNSDGNVITVGAGDLRSLIERVQFAADKKDAGARFALTGVKLESTTTTLRMVATDSKRLAVAECPATITGDPIDSKKSILLPRKALGLLCANLTTGDDATRIIVSDNTVCFSDESYTIVTRLVEGRYPPWQDILKQSKKGEPVTIPAREFTMKVRQAAITTDDESVRVDMVFGDDKVTMRARGVASGASEVVMDMPCSKKLSIAFDPHYLIEFAKSAQGSFEMCATSGDKPVVFRSGDDYTYLVMPLSN